MNDLLKQRIQRALDTLPDDKGYEVLDFIEFLGSRYAERSRPTGFLARLTERVEDTMRAAALPVKAVTGTVSAIDGAARVMRGLAAAGEAVMQEAVRAAEGPRAPVRVEPQAPRPVGPASAPVPPPEPPRLTSGQ